VPHRATGTSLEQPLGNTLPPASGTLLSSTQTMAKDRCVCRQARCTEGLRSPGFLFSLFTLASRCSLIQLRLLFQGLGAACHKPYKPSKAIAGPGVPAGLWPDCWGCGCWPGWRSADCACADQKARVRGAGPQGHGGEGGVAPWSLEATVRGLSIASQDGQSPQVQIARIYIDASCNRYGAWLRCWTLCRSMTP
jgi:hypothetical protein